MQNLSKLANNIFENDQKYKFDCPYCHSNTGHLYKKNLQFHCYTCYIHENLIQLYENNKIEIPNYNSLLRFINDYSIFRFDPYIIDILDENAIDRSQFYKIYHLCNIEEDKRSYRFLYFKSLLNFHNSFAYNKEDKQIYILNLTKDDKVIGYHIINLLNEGSIDSVFSLNDIRKKLDLPQISNSYNRLSIISNICLTDFNKEVYFFDNVLNSLILDNSIYINNSVDCFSHIKHKYVYSNDVYGIKKFEDRIKSDLAFDWKKFLKENKIKNKIYDILDLYKYEIKNEVKFDLEKYFYGNK